MTLQIRTLNHSAENFSFLRDPLLDNLLCKLIGALKKVSKETETSLAYLKQNRS